ncbi:MAG: tRNA (adenosine(37)-N6)-dimethylallyltransferase MiaA [Planctomycetaceae bacterium]|nr:tRNA (adenosine(37)-N6)-dimethylallyltransferase MiaA [Planctomycetaceae bacterium]
MQLPDTLLQQCWFLAGPTAVGKTALSLELAERLGAEIVALDSMTFYRGMDIGTAKPDAATRAQVPHHLLDILDPHEEFSLADYLRAVEQVCGEIFARNRVPLFVGGTGLYLRTVLRGVLEGPPADWVIRRRWEQFALSQGEPALHARLAEVDPTLAQKLHPNDVRRIIRGLEVFELTGVRLSQQQQQPPRPVAVRSQHVYWLSPPRDWLSARIDARVRQMFDDGLIEEVSRLLEAEKPLSRTARQALGYKEVINHLERGTGRAEVLELVQTRTRQFSKRQHTWFRNLEECRAIEIRGDENPSALVNQLTVER